MILNDRYEYNPKEDRLGKGGFGTVYKAFDLQEQKVVALKFVQKSKLPERYSLYNEILRIRELDHPNLVKYYDAFVKEYENVAGEHDEMHIGVMEYINGGDLGAFMKMPGAKNPRRIRMLLKGILQGIQYLHQHKIIHRDIKPQNILLQIDQGKIIPKIADFSISKQVSSELTSISATVGTYEYMSPEQLGKSDVKMGLSTDIWSFGVLAYQLLIGELPFGSRRKGDTDGQIIANILNPAWKVDTNQLESPYAEIVQKCLQKDPYDRFQRVEDILAFFPEEPEPASETAEKLSSELLHLKPEAKLENTIFFEENEPNTKTNFPSVFSEVKDEPSENEFKFASSQEALPYQNDLNSIQPKASNIANQLTRTLPPYTENGSDSKENEPFEEAIDHSSNRWAVWAVLVILAVFGIYLMLDWASTKHVIQEKISENVPEESSKNEQTQEDTQITPSSSTHDTNLPSTKPSENKNRTTQPEPSEEETWKVEVEVKEKNKPKVSAEENNTNQTSSPTSTQAPKEKEKKNNIKYTASRKFDYVEEYPNGSIVSLDGKYGYLDTYGNTQIPLKYDDFVNFQEGLAAVKLGTQWGYINTRNQVIIPFRYERPGVFNGGIALVTLNGKDIYIDKKGKCVRDCE
ncbi:MAG: protein kinase [Microscillaceae bacterium]|nr:protein kinase [Microscillaceae bacterium]